MKLYVLLTIFPAMLLIGCTGSEAPETDTVDVDNDLDDADHGMANADDDAPAADGDSIALTPDNTTIAFIGSHVTDEKPDPKARKGQFEKFDGTAVVEGGELKSLEVAIDTTSITTEQDKLTNHLKSPDFFDVKQYPTIKFTSTKVEMKGGKMMVTGDLELHGKKKSVTAVVEKTFDGAHPMMKKPAVGFHATFSFKRSDFGMNYMVGKGLGDNVDIMIGLEAVGG